MNYARNPKVILLGDVSVGKTAIIHTLMNGEFPHKLISTMGACFQRYECSLSNGKTVSMDIWDTAGQQKYRSLLVMYYKKSDVIIMVFDITREETFQTVDFWSSQINQHCENKPSVILVGNKYDLKKKQKVVSQERIRNYIKEKGWEFFYASALTGHNIKEIFERAAELSLETQTKNEKKQKEKSALKVRKSIQSKRKSSCC